MRRIRENRILTSMSSPALPPDPFPFRQMGSRFSTSGWIGAKVARMLRSAMAAASLLAAADCAGQEEEEPPPPPEPWQVAGVKAAMEDSREVQEAVLQNLPSSPSWLEIIETEQLKRLLEGPVPVPVAMEILVRKGDSKVIGDVLGGTYKENKWNLENIALDAILESNQNPQETLQFFFARIESRDPAYDADDYAGHIETICKSNPHLADDVAKRLVSTDENVLVAAIRGLGETDGKDIRHAKSLASLLDQETFPLAHRLIVVQALGRLSERNPEIGDLLVPSLGSDDPDIIVSACETFGTLGHRATRHAKHFLPLLEKSRNSIVRHHACGALSEMGDLEDSLCEQAVTLLEDQLPLKADRGDLIALQAEGQTLYLSKLAILLRSYDSEPSGIEIDTSGFAARALLSHVSRSPDLREKILSELNRLVVETEGKAMPEMAVYVATMLDDPPPIWKERFLRMLDAPISDQEKALELLKKMGPKAATLSSELWICAASGHFSYTYATEFLEIVANSDQRAGLIEIFDKDGTDEAKANAAMWVRMMGDRGTVYEPQLRQLMADDGRTKAGGGTFQPATEAALALTRMGKADMSTTAVIRSALDEELKKVPRNWSSTRIMRGMKTRLHILLASLANSKGQSPRNIRYDTLFKHLVGNNEIGAARLTLKKLHELGARFPSEIPPLLIHEGLDIRQDGLALMKEIPMEDAPWSVWAQILESVSPLSESELWNFRAAMRISAGTDGEKQLALTWLGRPYQERQADDVPVEEAREVMPILEELLKCTVPGDDLRKEICSRIDDIAGKERLVKDAKVREGLLKIRKQLLKDPGAQATVSDIDRALVVRKWWQQPSRWMWIAAGHLVIWILLLLAYPVFPVVQGLFWNHPLLRKWGGLGYVQLAVTAAPFLRTLMLKPFRDSLVPEGEIGELDAMHYFSDSWIVRDGMEGAVAVPALKTLSPLAGQKVVQGASGAGKTALLRYLAMTSERTRILLRATDCPDGVVAAIQGRLQGQVKDEAFLRTLIHSGAMDIYIDGLNEAEPDTRVTVVKEVEQHFKGNVLMTTQPMDWSPPRSAQKWKLLPLEVRQIVDFLQLQGEGLADDAKAAYDQRVRDFVTKLSEEAKTDEIQKDYLDLLRNPMQATFAAEVLKQGEIPELSRVIDQRLEKATLQYQEENNATFPWDRLSVSIFEWAKGERGDFNPPEELGRCVRMLVRHKLMIERKDSTTVNGAPAVKTRWMKRHDRVMELLMLPFFLNHPEARKEHCSDIRFAGIYVLLVQRLDMGEAEKLENFLKEKAVDTGNYRLFTPVSLALRARKRAEAGISKPTDTQRKEFMERFFKINQRVREWLDTVTPETPLAFSCRIAGTTPEAGEPVKTTGRWEPGNDRMVISKRLVEKLGLQQEGLSLVSTELGQVHVPAYYVNLAMGDEKTFDRIRVTAEELPEGHDLVIGKQVEPEQDSP